MSSPKLNAQHKPCGEPPQLSPRKLSASLSQNTTSDNGFVLDVDQILIEARRGGATEEQISRFFAGSLRAQIKDLLADDSLFEKYLDPNDNECTRAERIRALRQAKEDEWVAGHDEYLRKQEQRQAQSERDKSRRSTPIKERPSTPQGTPDSLTPGSTPENRKQFNKAERQRRQVSLKLLSDEEYSEYIAEQRRVGQERKARNVSGLSNEWGSNYSKRAEETGSMSPTPTKITPVPAPVHGPLVDRTRPSAVATMDSTKEIGTRVQLNHEIDKNTEVKPAAAAPTEGTDKPKKDKAPKQPKTPKAAPPAAPLTPAVIDLRVGHILRAVEHPNADTMYVSTIAMGDPEGAEHTEIDAQTGKVVRTVCSGLKAYVPLAEMQDRKIVVVANLKPANLRSIKSAAMVLAASPKPEEGADPHSPDRTIELVQPPEGSEAGDKVYFEGWPYGEGKGPEKQLNPKKKMWEALQPGFYTTEDLVVAFDAGMSEMEGSGKGELVVEGKGKCTVKSLKGAIVR
jgi:tRNA-binding EMAP/Myf-like protein